MNVEIAKERLGKIGEQELIGYTLSNQTGLKIRVLNFGGIIDRLICRDNNEQEKDIVLGYADPLLYGSNPLFYGGIIGRFANRIAHGQFTLNGCTYLVEKNDGANHLHGGSVGFIKRFWEVDIIGEGIKLSRISRHMEEGYPGTVQVSVEYRLLENELHVKYAAKTDQPTIINLTNHSYFNLNGEDGSTIENHLLKINSDKILPINKELIPSGHFLKVDGTDFDFQNASNIGDRLKSFGHSQMKMVNGYDHTFINPDFDGSLQPVARVYSPKTGIELDILTTEPGLHLYCGDIVGEPHTSKTFQSYSGRAGICLESQHFPDSPNQPSFPSTTLNPDRPFSSTTVYKVQTR